MAITRAKKAMWILGNAATLERSPVWSALITDARERQAVVPHASSAKLFPDCPLNAIPSGLPPFGMSGAAGAHAAVAEQNGRSGKPEHGLGRGGRGRGRGRQGAGQQGRSAETAPMQLQQWQVSHGPVGTPSVQARPHDALHPPLRSSSLYIGTLVGVHDVRAVSPHPEQQMSSVEHLAVPPHPTDPRGKPRPPPRPAANPPLLKTPVPPSQPAGPLDPRAASPTPSPHPTKQAVPSWNAGHEALLQHMAPAQPIDPRVKAKAIPRPAANSTPLQVMAANGHSEHPADAPTRATANNVGDHLGRQSGLGTAPGQQQPENGVSLPQNGASAPADAANTAQPGHHAMSQPAPPQVHGPGDASGPNVLANGASTSHGLAQPSQAQRIGYRAQRPDMLGWIRPPAAAGPSHLASSCVPNGQPGILHLGILPAGQGQVSSEARTETLANTLPDGLLQGPTGMSVGMSTGQPMEPRMPGASSDGWIRPVSSRPGQMWPSGPSIGAGQQVRSGQQQSLLQPPRGQQADQGRQLASAPGLSHAAPSQLAHDDISR